MTTKKTFYIKTYGCSANLADSKKVIGIFNAFGFDRVARKEEADIVVLNTCSVRQKSEDKVYGFPRSFKETDFKTQRPFVILMGCMVGSVKGDRTRYSMKVLEKKVPWVDVFLSPDEISNLPSILFDASFIDAKTYGSFVVENVPSFKLSKSFKDFEVVNISSGCDNFCSYCVVPYCRGKEISRSKDDILKEVLELVSLGVKKVMLCAQNANSWGLSKEEKGKIRVGDTVKLPFAQLLREVHEIDGLEEIAFLSSNPFDFTDDLINVLKLPKISNYLHIAVQSGNNDILKKMNRKHTIEEFVGLISKIKKVRSDIELGTDVIVGFPTETENQFEDTVKLFEKIKFNVAFVSMYSERVGTMAAKMYEDDVPLAEKRRRHRKLMQVWEESKNEK